jgi:hypothetical protein
VFDTLTHERSYKRAWSIDDALAEIRYLRGRQFDPVLTDLFLDLVRKLSADGADLDEVLARPAQESGFVKSRRRIAALLRGEAMRAEPEAQGGEG